jgi:hypothetical protein
MKIKFLNTVAGLTLSACCFLNVANAGVIALDDWFDTAGTATGGITQSQFNNGLYFAVAQDIDFSTTDTYEITDGWHIASYAEYTNLHNSYQGSINGYVHSNRNGWTQYTSASGSEEHKLFAFADMFDETLVDAGIHSGLIAFHGSVDSHIYAYGENLASIDKNTFAGLVVISDGSTAWGADVEVPEPSTLAIFALGMVGLASRRFKKQS